MCDFVCSYGYQRSLYRADRLPRELTEWRFSRLTAGGSRWDDETALVRIPGELRCVVVEKRGAARARTGVPTLPFPQGKLRVAPDGSLWAATHEWRLFEGRPRYAPLLLRSVDDGHTWELRGEARYQGDEWDDPLAAPRDGFIEPDWCFMPDGSAVCLMRTKNGHGHGPLYLARSVDGCRSRSRPKVFDSFGKMPQLLTFVAASPWPPTAPRAAPVTLWCGPRWTRRAGPGRRRPSPRYRRLHMAPGALADTPR